ncbi:MAG: glycosyl transferase family 2 [Oligoflexus sp.]
MVTLPTHLSIVVPVGGGDLAWKTLLQDLPPLPHTWELIFIMVDSVDKNDWQACLRKSQQDEKRIHWVKAQPPGRAWQLNQGGDIARGHWLWFLHADSVIDQRHLTWIEGITTESKRALYYFDLSFTEAKLNLMALNQWGANIRSRYLGMPFGDQGFLLERQLWLQLGRFETGVAYGEDHKFAWTCHQQRIPLQRVPLAIRTSSRKYQQYGWFQTTKKHFILTWKQALPELWKLMKQRIGAKP